MRSGPATTARSSMPDLPRYVPPAPDRLAAVALMLDSLSGLLGQAESLDTCGQHGIAALLDLLAERIEDATEEILRQPSG